MFFLFEIVIIFLFILYSYCFFNPLIFCCFLGYCGYNYFSYRSNKTNFLKKMILAGCYFLYLSGYFYFQKKLNDTIGRSRYFVGYFLSKEKNEKNYKYQFFVECCYGPEGKEYINQAVIDCYAKKEIPLYTHIIIPKIYFFKDQLITASSIKGMAYFWKEHQYQLKKTFFLQIKEKLMQWREQFISYIESFFDSNEINFGIFQRLFLGRYNQVEYGMKNLFMIFGIQHYLARSGLHIAIIGDILFIILAFFGLHNPWILIFQTIILGFFYIFSYQSISFFRAFLMLVLVMLSHLLKIQTTSLHVLLATVLIVLIGWPFEFLNLSTQLTFGTTAILCLINYR